MPTVMTQSHFEFVAGVIKTLAVERADREQVAMEFAHALQATNPRFKRTLFLKACGVEKERMPRKEY